MIRVKDPIVKARMTWMIDFVINLLLMPILIVWYGISAYYAGLKEHLAYYPHSVTIPKPNPMTGYDGFIPRTEMEDEHLDVDK